MEILRKFYAKMKSITKGAQNGVYCCEAILQQENTEKLNQPIKQIKGFIS